MVLVLHTGVDGVGFIKWPQNQARHGLEVDGRPTVGPLQDGFLKQVLEPVADGVVRLPARLAFELDIHSEKARDGVSLLRHG